MLFCAELIKNGFLQQNSFDAIDMYCSPEKQIRILDVIVRFYRKGKDLLAKGIGLSSIMFLENVSEIVRLKSEIPNERPELIDEFRQKIEGELSVFDNQKQHVSAGEDQ